jgi:hypothetical protein
MLALAIVEAELRVNQTTGRPLVEVVDTDDPNWHDREALLAAAVADNPEQTIHLLAHMFAAMMRRTYGDDALEWLDRFRWVILDLERDGGA